MQRLIDYRDGIVKSIPELEEKIVPITDKLINYNCWRKYVSANMFDFLY
jgi:hypothetical protein